MLADCPGGEVRFQYSLIYCLQKNRNVCTQT